MNELNTLKATEKPVLLQFSATWCGPCKMLSPIIDDVERKIGGMATVKRIDVDSGSQLVVDFFIRSVPTLVILDKHGDIYWRHIGLVSEKEILKRIESLT